MSEHYDDLDYIHPLRILPASAPSSRVTKPMRKALTRRQALSTIGAVGLGSLLAGCGSSSFSALTTTAGTTTGSTPADTTTGSDPETCSVVPSETEGPYPASSVLANASIYRSNITTDIATGVAKTGIPLMVFLNLKNTNGNCAAISNAAIYIWHCDKEGEYSGYSSSQNGSHASETFLRGVQISDSAGQVSFSTIYPGWYNGRITHIHFEIFLNNNLSSNSIKISQMAFPAADTTTVYNSSLYVANGQNTITSYSQDNVFSDGVSQQLVTLSGSVVTGYIATLNVGVAA